MAEAVTWALLLIGMVLKYVTDITELGVRVFGMVHGVVFIAYWLTTLLVAVDQRWTARRTLLGLVSAVPPFMTVWFDRYAERRGALAAHWRLATAEPRRGARPRRWPGCCATRCAARWPGSSRCSRSPASRCWPARPSAEPPVG